MNENVLSAAIGNFVIALSHTEFTDENSEKLKKILGDRIFFRAFGNRFFVDIWILASLPAEVLQKNTLKILKL